MRVGITGASGLIGTALRDHLRSLGHEAVPFVRRPPATGEIGWRPDEGRLDAADLAPLDAVVNLAGASIGGRRWNDAYRRLIRDSRVLGTELMAAAVARSLAEHPRPFTLLSGSAVGFYGDRGDEPLDEGAPSGGGFLADVCRAWERATAPAAEAGARVAHLRTGIVLARHGGALAKMLPLFRLGLGGRFGDGRQWMSWIALDDEVRAIVHLLDQPLDQPLDEPLIGPVNLAAPGACPNAELARTLGRVLRRPAVVPVPAFGPRLALGRDMAQALLLDGQRAVPAALTGSGFEFRHAELEPALRAILDR